MNSKDWDFRVSRLFGESDADYAERNRRVKNLEYQEEQNRQYGRELNSELDHLHKLHAIINQYIDFLIEHKRTNIETQRWVDQLNGLSKQIERIQNERSSIWKDIKEIQRKRNALG